MPTIPGVWIRCECGKLHILTTMIKSVCPKCGKELSWNKGR